MKAVSNSNVVINPLIVSQLLVGLENGKSDKTILNFLKDFCTLSNVKKAAFIHALPVPDFFSVNEYVDTIQNQEKNEEQLVTTHIAKEVQIALKGSDTSYTVSVAAGKPLELLLKSAEDLNSDLVVIGQKTDYKSHGITAKNFIRQVKCNALIIPDKTEFKLNKILVAIDFSENSAKALRTSIALSKSFKPRLHVEALHLFELPPNSGTYRFSETKLLQLIQQDRQESMSMFIDKHIPEEDQKNIISTVRESVRWPIGNHIAEYAKESKCDMIVTGAKGHSKLSLLLLGSVTEKIISYTQTFPVLIVK